MSYTQRYLGRSAVKQAGGASAVSLVPNLARPKVFFDGELRHPVRFREAMSALHEVVVGDLRFNRKDRAAYERYLAELRAEEQELQREAFDEARRRELLAALSEPEPPDLKKRFKQAHKRYYKARSRWIRDLFIRDNKLWWLLDPVVTVAPDVVLFECFSKDESSYGCLTVDRDGFSSQERGSEGLGTTNVDYSVALYEHFQTLRSYRPTRLAVDPAGFEVQVAGHPDFREEKIDLPASWLRGFGQIQAAQVLPATQLRLGRAAAYSLLAYLGRHRERKSPRALRFELTPGMPPRLILEPWEKEIQALGSPVDLPGAQTIRVWGKRRLLVLSRLLPLLEGLDVYLLGSGLPSVWVARLGEMTFTLALSGWTTNDWSSGANLALLAGRFQGSPEVMARALEELRKGQRASLAQLKAALGPGVPERALLGSLHQLALRGQLIFDHAHGVYRYRCALPEPLGVELLGEPHPELSAAQRFMEKGKVQVERSEPLAQGRVLIQGRVGKTHCEALLDGDGAYLKAQCSCSLFYKNKLKAGPCRHILALKLVATAPRFGEGSGPHLVS